MDVDSGIRVSVVPSQSAYFAGEPFSVSVTFTNTRSPTQAAKRTVSHFHKRAAHSISSAPLARPPTSPITPRTAVPPIVSPPRDANKTKKKFERKGLIGIPRKDDSAGKRNGSHALVEQWRGKSYSTTLSPQDITSALSTPSASSPLRDGSLPVNHPHARKQSLQDGQLDAQLNVRELSSPAPAPTTSSASTSAFSLSLDTISEHSPETHPYPPKRRPPNLGLGIGPPPPPLGPGEHKPPHTAYASSTFTQPGTELVLYAYAQLSGTVTLGGDGTQTETRAQAQALNAVRSALQRKQAFGGGRMDISSTLDSSKSGDMSPRRRSHGRAVSLSSSIMSLLAPPPPTPSQKQWTPGHKPRSPSMIASFITPSASSPASFGTSGTMDASEEVPAETPLPVFEVQPSMLAVDLVLAPAESRTYTYSLSLPDNLPPTCRGRIIKFAYHLSVGVCRATPGPSPGLSSQSGKGSTSQVMRVPIRVYNHVDVSGVQRPYDLLWPILHPPLKDQTGQVCELKTVSSNGASPAPGIGKKASGTGSPGIKQLATSPALSTSSPILGSVGTLNPALELRSYAQRLLDACADPSGNGLRAPVEIEALSPTAEAERELRARGNGELTGCREAVEILTRNMRKVSYDVNKDGVKVAVLTFTKSAYRLGETVVGVVELNELASRARVLKLSAMLEAHETLPSSLNPSSSSSGGQRQNTKKLRKLHAEYHASLTLSTLRTSFALDIPSDATPAFQYVCAPPTFSPSASAISLSSPRSSSSSLHSSSLNSSHIIPPKSSNPPTSTTSSTPNATPVPGGLTWTIRLCLLVVVASPYARKGLSGARVKGLVQDGPHGEWGTSWRATRGIAPLQNVDLKAVRKAEMRASRSGTRTNGKDGYGKNGKDGNGRNGKDVRGEEEQGGGGWASYFSSFLSGSGEREYHDGDEYLSSSSSSSSQSSSPSHSRSSSPSRYLDGVKNGSIDETRTIRPGPPPPPSSPARPNPTSPSSPMSKTKLGSGAMPGIDLDPGGGEDGWSELRAETVECEVPVRVWPGNTAFRPMEVVFEV